VTEAHVNCMRCGTLRTLVITEDDIDDSVSVEVAEGGIVACVCEDCMTAKEALERARQSASALLDAAEEALAAIKMVMERLPTAADDPRFKEAKASEARRMLDVLMTADVDDEETGGER
jgi:hypothetical protein